VAPHEVCNEISCITVNKLFFITDSSILCPPGNLKVAYNDQAGKFRAASAQTNKARRSVDKRLLEDCERIETNPHYMNPTVSSLQKVKKNMRKTITSTTTAITTTTTETAILKNNLQFDLSSILTDDNSFQTAACSVSIDDLEYLNRKFPLAALLSFIFTLVQLLAKRSQVQPKITSPNAYSSPTRPSHSTFAHFASALQGFTFSRQPESVIPASQQATTAIPLPFNDSERQQNNLPAPRQTIPTVSSINEVENYRTSAFCGCSKGNCVSGNCRCYKAKRACGPLCHGRKENLKCEATLAYYLEQLNS